MISLFLTLFLAATASAVINRVRTIGFVAVEKPCFIWAKD
jgi:hypothetical protein